MKTRYRWYEATFTAADLKRLAEAMLKDQFSARSSIGFKIEAVRRDWVRAELIERFETVEVTETPTGERLEFPFVGFNRATFRLTTAAPGLELVNPSKLARTLITRLGEILDFELSVKPYELNPIDWLEALERRVGPAIVTGITISDIAVSEVVRAQVKLEGSKDVREHVNRFVRSKSYVTDSIRATVKRSGVDLELGRLGRGWVDNSDLIDALRGSLAATSGE